MTFDILLRSKIRWKNLWNIFFLIFNAFFSLILYHPGFYSSLSDKKQRNGGSSNIPTILVKFAKNGCRNNFVFIHSAFLVKCWQNLPISQTFWNAAISLFFIAQWVVKTRMIENWAQIEYIFLWYLSVWIFSGKFIKFH